MKKATERNHELGRTVGKRVFAVSDLMAQQTVYHRDCHVHFMQKYGKYSQRGRPEDEEILKAINNRYSYFESYDNKRDLDDSDIEDNTLYDMIKYIQPIPYYMIKYITPLHYTKYEYNLMLIGTSIDIHF